MGLIRREIGLQSLGFGMILQCKIDLAVQKKLQSSVLRAGTAY